MTKKNQNLPDFEKPPVIEVYLSLQFQNYGDKFLNIFGLFDKKLGDKFPNTELRQPLVQAIEKFEIQKRETLKIKVKEDPQMPRCLFINKDENKLIQIQQDRFVFNWRKNDNSGEYLRYPKVFSGFRTNIKKFQELLLENDFDRISPEVCEIKYINFIKSEDIWSSHSETNKVFTIFRNKYSDGFLKNPEDIRCTIRYRICDDKGESIGRLHFEIEPLFLIETKEPIFQLSITARGKPLRRGMAGAERFFNLGREQIVRGFASITTKKMHEKWGRKDV